MHLSNGRFVLRYSYTGIFYTNVQPWPVYDRIYVGAAVTSRLHLQSILRLLKVGGILVVPYRDKISINILLCTHRFIITAPKQNVISLEKLAARIIRNLLRHYLINHAEIGNDGSPIEDTNSNRTNSGDVQNDTTGDNALDAETGGSDGTATENHHSNSPYLRINFCRFLNGVSNTIIGTSTVCEHSNEDEDNQINGILNTSASVDNESTIDEHVKNKSTPHKQRKKYRWVPPSYTYKEEMKRILSEELRLGKPLIRSVITL
ncbi:putative protein-l-isoaspartate o-methyltransferase [Schistosoma mansoni]|uniref:putative protein-l-isoaspartate o-methyltransferase n=1 Tax=Schistosoma mansoni TaxID=6183 RepID=UPI00022DCBFD|nr:putative protein-l-isoaspartate o-methyltransferase [Schistosoma mansoni]|eukprot:XP_018654715.1 putative protein-l-isoaspartate o-methyltransferase [Schistosoma mansoni]